MIKLLKGIINDIRHAVRDISTGGQRSPKWAHVQETFRKLHPKCAACGSQIKIQVHHKRPFHLFPKLELDPNNLISLCMDKNKCHLLIGHGNNFKSWNPDVVQDAVNSLSHPEQRSTIVEHAKKIRIFGVKDQ